MHLYMVTKNREDHGTLVIGHCHPSALGRAMKDAQHVRRARLAGERPHTDLLPKNRKHNPGLTITISS